MANYDTPGLTYDSGVFYDAAPVPPTPNKRMAKVKLNLDRLSDGQLIQKAKDIKTKLTGNANFPATTPTLANFTTLITAADTALAAFDAANATAKQLTTEKNTALDALRRGTAQLGTSVEALSGGDAAKIQSAGMDVKAAASPIGTLTQVTDFALSAGDHDGELDAQWSPVNGAKSYELETSPDPMTTTSWGGKQSTTKSKLTLTGLTSGARVWARVRAIGAAGSGNWSDPATKIVP
jgi:hypothetical protein